MKIRWHIHSFWWLVLQGLILAALANIPHGVKALERDKLEQARRSVVVVRGYQKAGELSYGSGVVIAHNQVVTNCHVLREARQAWVSRGETSYTIQSIQADTWHDLCLLNTDELPLPPATLNAHPIDTWQEVAAIGHSNATPRPLVSIGRILAQHVYENGYVIRSSAKFDVGASGSGLFDGQGRLVGINTFRTAGRQAYFYALSPLWIAHLSKQPVRTLPILDKTFWETNPVPFFMQVAQVKQAQDWQTLAEISAAWIKTEHKNAEAWYNAGLAQLGLKHMAEAKTYLHKALAYNQHHYGALLELNRLAQAEHDEKTLKEIQRVLAQMSEDVRDYYQYKLDCQKNCY